MAIYLTGGGEQEDFQKLDRHFLDNLDEQAKILLIPQACEESEYDDIQERIEDAFKSKKVSTIDLCRDPESYDWDRLNEYSALVFEGGNTFKLVNSIRETSFFSLIKKFYEAGKHLYADSAGAILLGSDVQTAFLGDDADEDQEKLQDYRGLDLFPPWAVHAHYQPEEYQDLQDLLYDKGNTIIALPEPGGVCIENGSIKSLGSEAIEIITFDGRTSLSPGQEHPIE